VPPLTKPPRTHNPNTITQRLTTRRPLPNPPRRLDQNLSSKLKNSSSFRLFRYPFSVSVTEAEKIFFLLQTLEQYAAWSSLLFGIRRPQPLRIASKLPSECATASVTKTFILFTLPSECAPASVAKTPLQLYIK
jgi:hypothetical protein